MNRYDELLEQDSSHFGGHRDDTGATDPLYALVVVIVLLILAWLAIRVIGGL